MLDLRCGVVVVGGFAAGCIEVDLEGSIARIRRGEPPAEPVVPRAGTAKPQAQIGRADQPVAEQRHAVTELALEPA